ncbi:hypothetical protein N9C85_01620 [Synechococcus sp. AH-224-I15]|nr:hypothetical protein [Synechococcus sp. AH-224-I15]
MLVEHAALLEAAKRATGWQQSVTATPGFMRPLPGKDGVEWFVQGAAGCVRLEIPAEHADVEVGATGAALLDMAKLVTGRDQVSLTTDVKANQTVLVADGGYRDAVPMAGGWCPADQADPYESTMGERVWKWNLANQEWVALLEAGVWAAAPAETNPQMAFVEFTAKDTTLTVRACDGVKIAQASGCLLEPCQDMTLVLPTAVAASWLEMARSNPEMSQACIANRTEQLVMHWGNTKVLCFTPLPEQTELGLADLIGGLAERESIAQMQISTATRRDMGAVCGHGGEAVTIKAEDGVVSLRTLHRSEAARDMTVHLPATGVGEGEIAVDSGAFLEACRLMNGLVGLSVGTAGMNRALIIEAESLGGLHTLIALVGLAV